MKYRIIIALALIPQVILVNFLKDNPSLIDKYYVGFFYNSVFNVNTFVFSKINFPIGEILYIIIILCAFYYVIVVYRYISLLYHVIYYYITPQFKPIICQDRPGDTRINRKKVETKTMFL